MNLTSDDAGSCYGSQFPVAMPDKFPGMFTCETRSFLSPQIATLHARHEIVASEILDKRLRESFICSSESSEFAQHC